jgi:hypothetical protein
LTAARTAVASAVAGAADRRAKSKTLGLEVLPRCLACGLDESRPLAGGCARCQVLGLGLVGCQAATTVR